SGSTTGLVLNRPDILDAALVPGRREDEPFTVVLHRYPDLDAVASAYLAVSYLAEGRFPAGAELLARYVDKVDEGTLGMTPERPSSLCAAGMRRANRPEPQAADDAENWQRSVRDGLRLIGHVLARAEADEVALSDVDAFACPGVLGEEDRRAVLSDRQRYEDRLADPRTRARTARLSLPGQF